jgi:hypothetical protein
MDTLSDFELAQLEHPELADSAIVTKITDGMVRDLELAPPVDLALLASARGVSSIDVAEIPWAGCLVPDPQRGMRIQLRSGDSPGRQRFTACHEVAHTIMPGFTTTSYRCAPGEIVPGEAADKRIETLCDLTASQLLMPRVAFLRDLAGLPFGWLGLHVIADTYVASLEAVARRVVAVAEQPTLFLALRPGISRSNPQPRLRITSRAHGGDWPYIPKNKSVPLIHPLQDALAGELVDTITDLRGLTADNRPTPVRLSARLFPLHNLEGEPIMRVLAIATPLPEYP